MNALGPPLCLCILNFLLFSVKNIKPLYHFAK